MQRALFPDQEINNTAVVPFPEVSETPVSWGEINLQRADKYKAIVNDPPPHLNLNHLRKSWPFYLRRENYLNYTCPFF